MDFLSLPVEIGLKILNYLDMKTQINLYNSCSELREYFASWFHLKKVNLSRSTLATAKTLEEKIFVDLGEHILELNLSGIPDLTVDNLKPYIKSFVNLKSLDVTFTNIYLVDITEICPPNLKNISINFLFEYFTRYDRIAEETKNVFKERKFEAVHFVVTKIGLSASPLNFLKDIPSIKDLKLTLSDNYKDYLSVSTEDISTSGDNKIEINFNKMTIVARDCAVTHKFAKELKAVSRLNFQQIEYIFMMYLEKIEIYVSPLLANIFTVSCSDLKVEVSTYLQLNFMLDGNIIFKAWNKNTTKFDDNFFKDLLLELKDYFPTYICMHSRFSMKITDAVSSWFCIDKCENFEKIPDLPDKVILTDFCRRDGIVMKVQYPINITVAPKFLQNLTFLRINNIPIRNVFFKSLFEQCLRLTTLVIYMEDQVTVRSYTQSLAKAIHLAKLKNFMLISEDIQYEIVFAILSRCSSLENVHICEYERDSNLIYQNVINKRNKFVFIKNCANLYSVYIEADMTVEDLTMMMGSLRAAAQKLERNHLNINVCQLSWGWNPFADVFSPSPLHICN